MRKAALTDAAGAKHSGAAAKVIVANTPCPDAILCRRWSADDGGAYCRFCWRDFTYPKPLQVTEGRV